MLSVFIIALIVAWLLGTVAVLLRERKNKILFIKLGKFSIIGALIGTFVGFMVGMIIATNTHPSSFDESTFILGCFMVFGCFLGVVIATLSAKEDWIKA